MPLFPNTLIRCIAEGRTPDESEISEIALHIRDDMDGSATEAPPSGSCKGLRAAAQAALCGSPVPHLAEARTQGRRWGGYRDDRSPRPSPVVRARAVTVGRIPLADDPVGEPAWL